MIDKFFYSLYDKNMKQIAIIGGGASGMACAVRLARQENAVTIYERGERLGRKLAATGNGQGNVTNLDMGAEHYFSDDIPKVSRALERFSCADTVRFLESMGGIFLPDARGRVYPAGRQASAVTDLFRRESERLGVQVVFNAQILELTRTKGAFRLQWSGGEARADAVVLAAGGRAAPNFGTDGNAYRLAQAFGHTVTGCSPALVQLKSDPALIRGLKGIRTDALLRVVRGGERIFCGRGDVLFTESGLSGDAVFRASSYARKGDTVEIDFLPDVSEERLKKTVFSEKDLLCVVNNGLARIVAKRAVDQSELIDRLKRFTLPVTGTLGYAYAQVTKGGVPLAETDDGLMSRFCDALYFAGEILNVDGECGGYNLQWAFTSAFLVSEAIGSC